MKIAIGSKNPVKIKAVKAAISRVSRVHKIFGKIDNIQFLSLDAQSGVSDQPMSEEETLIGAKNRAKYAKDNTNSDFGFGLEGGLMEIEDKIFMTHWVAVYTGSNQYGLASGGAMEMPSIVRKRLDEGAHEVGDVMDEILGESDIKKKFGAVGYFTKKLITRSDAFEYCSILAMTRFLNTEYNDDEIM